MKETEINTGEVNKLSIREYLCNKYPNIKYLKCKVNISISNIKANVVP